MKQLEVQIMGQSYLLGCPDGGDSRLLDAVERVDTAMCRIRDAGKVRARERIAVLAALNLAFDLSDRAQIDDTGGLTVDSPVNSTVNSTGKSGSAGVATAFLPPQGGPGGQAITKSGEDLLLTSLMARLDDALGDDGRLI